VTKVCLRHVPLDVRAEIPGMVPKVDSFGLCGSFVYGDLVGSRP